jgi:hypothetical protein
MQDYGRDRRIGSDFKACEATMSDEEKRPRYKHEPPEPMGEVWTPVMTEKEKQELEAYKKLWNLPF